MSILDKLSTSLNRRDEVPNQELAKKILKTKDKKAIKELAENLENKNKGIQSDCIKVLYEIGESNPSLIADYEDNFLDLLDGKNNRLIWGALTALDCIASVSSKSIYKNIEKIQKAANEGSVIAKDHYVNILIKLSSDKSYANRTIPLLFQQLEKAAINQLPMYAERAMPAVSGKDKKMMIKILTARLVEIEKESKIKRIRKVIDKLNK